MDLDIEKNIRKFLHRFELHTDKADETEIIENIKKGVEFTGTNLWLLILAVFIASVGLNVNSTAVIIGAMLISPLMGPIMGVGLGIGINDFDLIKRSIKNLSIATLFSIFTSFLYFLISPLSEAQSELLARTTPTIWDVIIAFIGGTAGIIGMTRKEKGNVVPGVAIATALMPPLCTSGYGLATGNFYYFLGAFYLFLINSVFISLSSYLIIRFIKIPKVIYLDKLVERKIKRFIFYFVVIVTIPSIYLAYTIVAKSIYESKVASFIKKEISFKSSILIQKNIQFENKIIELTFVGNPISEDKIENINKKLVYYGLSSTKIIINQDSFTSQDTFNALRNKLLEELVQRTGETIDAKDKKIIELENRNLYPIANSDFLLDLSKELVIYFPYCEYLVIQPMKRISLKTNELEDITIGILFVTSFPSEKEKNKVIEWLKARTKNNALVIYFQKAP
jgi:uncharacterized hydrophobic protein (TIGR00271 family)